MRQSFFCEIKKVLVELEEHECKLLEAEEPWSPSNPKKRLALEEIPEETDMDVEMTQKQADLPTA